jgi:gamma-tubulin complex component 3
MTNGVLGLDFTIALKHLFHTTRLAVADLRFFITQLQAFSHSEVIDCSWRVLEDLITTKAGGCDLDSLIAQHRLYLERLVSKALLMSGRKSANGEVSVSLRYYLVVVYCMSIERTS